jgi:hypothetical protein
MKLFKMKLNSDYGYYIAIELNNNKHIGIVYKTINNNWFSCCYKNHKVYKGEYFDAFELATKHILDVLKDLGYYPIPPELEILL